MDQGKLYRKQISFTEWFEAIGHSELKEMREEDYYKRDRLKELQRVIGIPFDKPDKFEAVDIVNGTNDFLTFYQNNKNEQKCLRLNPKSSNLKKHRLRGPTVQDLVKWFADLDIDPSQYIADFLPHSEKYVWSTIFIVNKNGISGEIIKGGHFQLTQGFYATGKPIVFSYDFDKWWMSEENQGMLKHLKEIVDYLFVNEEQKMKLKEKFGAEFNTNYLSGYFETVLVEDYGLWFVDWSRMLGKMYGDFTVSKVKNEGLSGVSASPGKATGKVRKITNPIEDEFSQGDILVCEMTSPDYIHLMKKASAIITEKGGVLTHAAIVSRELGIPCITGVVGVLDELKHGDEVEVDANSGVIRKLI